MRNGSGGDGGDGVERLARTVQDLADRHGVPYLVVRPHWRSMAGFAGATLPTAVREDQADEADRRNVVRRVEPAGVTKQRSA